MKKILALLGTVGLAVLPTTTTISCFQKASALRTNPEIGYGLKSFDYRLAKQYTFLQLFNEQEEVSKLIVKYNDILTELNNITNTFSLEQYLKTHSFNYVAEQFSFVFEATLKFSSFYIVIFNRGFYKFEHNNEGIIFYIVNNDPEIIKNFKNNFDLLDNNFSFFSLLLSLIISHNGFEDLFNVINKEKYTMANLTLHYIFQVFPDIPEQPTDEIN